jgi:hypothetical protein
MLLGVTGMMAVVSAAGCSPSGTAGTPPASTPSMTPTPPPAAITASPTPQKPPVFAEVGTMDTAAMQAAFLQRDGQVLVLVGDDPADEQPLGIVSAYVLDPATGQTTLKGATASGHYGAAIAQLQDGRVLVAGGLDGQRATTSAEIYDPESGTFSATGSTQFAFELRSAITLKDGRILVFGNAEGNPDSETYDPATGKFSQTGSMTIGRYGAGAALLPDGRVLVAGGSAPEDEAGPMGPLWYDSVTAEIYDPRTGKFDSTGEMASGMVGATTAVLPDGRVLLIGDAGEPEMYDPASGTFGPTGAFVEDRHVCSATVLHDGRILIAGGVESEPPEGTEDYRVLESTEYYNPVTNKFTSGAPMPTARWGHAALLMPDGSVLIIGGEGGHYGVLIGQAQSQSSVLLAKP